MKLDRMGVLVLLAHLIITLSIIAAYVTFTIMGKDVGTTEMILMAIVGYWFGAMGPSTIRKPAPQATTEEITFKKEGPANE